MKKLILFLGALYSMNAVANTACTANYAAGLGHVFKGESRVIGDKETIKANELTSDDLYTVSLQGETPVLSETKSKKIVELLNKDIGSGMKLYSTKSLELYPIGIPGAITDNKFIIILCADEELMK